MCTYPLRQPEHELEKAVPEAYRGAPLVSQKRYLTRPALCSFVWFLLTDVDPRLFV